MLSLESLFIEVPLVKGSESVREGRHKVVRSGREELPVIDETNHYLGMLRLSTSSDSELESSRETEADEPLHADEAPTALLRLMAEHDASLTAVVDREGVLVGCIDRQLALKQLSHMAGADEPGATICVRMRAIDFELGRLTGVIEQSGAKILSVMTERSSEEVYATVKIAQTDPYPPLEALERYGYDAAIYTESSEGDDDEDILRRNYLELMRIVNS